MSVLITAKYFNTENFLVKISNCVNLIKIILTEFEIYFYYFDVFKRSRIIMSTKTNVSKNKPRNLTEGEILYLSTAISHVNSPVQEIADFTVEAIKMTLRYFLHQIIITPLALEDLFEIIKVSYDKAVIFPGMAAGALAVEAVIQPVQQMTLNSFHQSGSGKNVTKGVEQILSYIKGSKNPKIPESIIHFNEILSFSDILKDKRPELVSLTIGQLVIDYSVNNTDEIRGDNMPIWYKDFIEIFNVDMPDSSKFLRLSLDVSKCLNMNVKMRKIIDLLNQEVPDSVWICYSPLLLAPFDTSDVRKKVVRYVDIHPINPRNAYEKLPDYIKESSFIVEENVNITESLFLEQVILPALNKEEKSRISGISGIKYIEPYEVPIWTSVGQENKIDHNSELLTMIPAENRKSAQHIANDKNVVFPTYKKLNSSNGEVWTTQIDIHRMKSMGISIRRICLLCRYVGMEVISAPRNLDDLPLYSDDPDYSFYERNIILLVPKYESLSENIKEAIKPKLAKINNEISPGIIVFENRQLDKEGEIDYYQNNIARKNVLYQERKALLENDPSKEDLIKAEQIRQVILSLSPIRPPTDLYKLITYVYATTLGTNLHDLLMRDDIDQKRTYTNNVYEILKEFGIETARSLLLKLIKEALEIGGKINSQNILLVANYMTRTGGISKISSAGITSQETGVMDKATSSRALQKLIHSASLGERAASIGVSQSVQLGTNVAMGTGYSGYRGHGLKITEREIKDIEGIFDKIEIESDEVDEEDAFDFDVSDLIDEIDSFDSIDSMEPPRANKSGRQNKRSMITSTSKYSGEQSVIVPSSSVKTSDLVSISSPLPKFNNVQTNVYRIVSNSLGGEVE